MDVTSSSGIFKTIYLRLYKTILLFIVILLLFLVIYCYWKEQSFEKLCELYFEMSATLQ